jgi:hypothetical protein
MASMESNNGNTRFPPAWWAGAADPGKNPPALTQTPERQQVVNALQQQIKALNAEWQKVDAALKR